MSANPVRPWLRRLWVKIKRKEGAVPSDSPKIDRPRAVARDDARVRERGGDILECMVGFCSICGSSELLPIMWIERNGIPHGSDGHHVQYGTTVLQICPQCRRGWLEQYSHDCWAYFGDEPWDMFWWFLLEPEDLQRLIGEMEDCPVPLDPKCSCDLHQTLRSAFERLQPRARAEDLPRCFTRVAVNKTEQGLTLISAASYREFDRPPRR